MAFKRKNYITVCGKMWSGPNLRKKFNKNFGVKHGKPQLEENFSWPKLVWFSSNRCRNTAQATVIFDFNRSEITNYTFCKNINNQLGAKVTVY